MRADALLVNATKCCRQRSPRVEALLEDSLGGYATDVLTGESAAGMGHHPLVQRAKSDPRILVTPHIGGATWESTHKTEEFLAARVKQWVLAQ